MEHRKVECDKCQADLTSTSNCEGWRLVLAPEGIPSRGGVVTLLMLYPPLDRPHHFCGLKCLKEWIESYQPEKRPHQLSIKAPSSQEG